MTDHDQAAGMPKPALLLRLRLGALAGRGSRFCHRSTWRRQVSPRFAQLPAALEGRLRPVGGGAVGRLERVAGEAVEQIHQQQLLVLLLVLQPQLQQRQRRGGLAGRSVRQNIEQLLQSRIDPCPPGQHRRDRRPAEQPPLRPGMAGADGVVVAVEQKAPQRIGGFVLDAVPLAQGPQQEFLEEPGGVAEVPFRRTGIGHALQHQILRLQGDDQRFTAAAHRSQAHTQAAEPQHAGLGVQSRRIRCRALLNRVRGDLGHTLPAEVGGDAGQPGLGSAC